MGAIGQMRDHNYAEVSCWVDRGESLSMNDTEKSAEWLLVSININFVLSVLLSHWFSQRLVGTLCKSSSGLILASLKSITGKENRILEWSTYDSRWQNWGAPAINVNFVTEIFRSQFVYYTYQTSEKQRKCFRVINTWILLILTTLCTNYVVKILNSRRDSDKQKGA